MSKPQRKRLDVGKTEERILKTVRKYELANSGRGIRRDDVEVRPGHIFGNFITRLVNRDLLEFRADGLIYTKGAARQMNPSWWKNDGAHA